MGPRRSASGVLRRLRIALVPDPGQSLGLAALVAVLTAALVSVPLVLGSAEQGAWQEQRRAQSAAGIGATLSSAAKPAQPEGAPTAPGAADVQTVPAGPLALVPDLDAAVAEAAAATGTGTPESLARFRVPLFAPARADFVTRAQLLHRDGAAGHVEVVDGSADTRGVLLPRRLADELGLGPGDTFAAESAEGLPTALPVAGVYADLVDPLPTWWEGQRELFVARRDPESGTDVLPPPVVLAPRDVVLAAAEDVQQDLFLRWSLPLAEGIGVGEARAAARRLEQLGVVLADPASPVAQLVTTADFPRPRPASELPAALAVVDSTVALLRPQVGAVGTGGGAAALVLVGAWAGWRTRRRGDELAALVARGVSPLRAAGTAGREALLPVLAGAVLGTGGAWALVRLGGPAADLPGSVWPRAGGALAVGALAALLVVGLVTGALVARAGQLSPGPLVQWLGRLPWLAVTAAVTAVAAVPLVTGDRGDRTLGPVPLAVPLLVTVVVAGAVTAALPLLGRRAGARVRRLPPAGFLVARRVLAAPGATRLVVVTTALSLGLVVYAGALADSSRRSLAAKAAVDTPADVVAPLVRRTVEEGALPPGATMVGYEEGLDVVPGGSTADLLAVRPDELPGIVHWDDALADRPLADLLAALADDRGTGRVPVVAAGPASGAPAVGRELEVSLGRYYAVPVVVVARAEAFPGQRSRLPLLVADWDSLGAALAAVDREPAGVLDRQVWAAGAATPLLEALAAAEYGVDETAVDTGGAFALRPEVRALSWSLGYLRAVALAAGGLGLVALALHAAAQQRHRTVAALLLARMGMSRRASDTAAGLETGLLAGLATVVALAVALPASALVLPLLDPVPAVLPGVTVAVPWPTVGLTVAGAALATAAATWLVGRAAGRTSGGQVMRDAG
ncbi:hypothetical protein [Modestobacter versicolor]|uniref:hypothetical protein n=1 Tax=Modestobacter versicolor TaxID=429133 RepID=UPI0034DE9D83